MPYHFNQNDREVFFHKDFAHAHQARKTHIHKKNGFSLDMLCKNKFENKHDVFDCDTFPKILQCQFIIKSNPSSLQL